MTENKEFKLVTVHNTDNKPQPSVVVRSHLRDLCSIVPLKAGKESEVIGRTIDLDCVFGHMSYSQFKKAYKQSVAMKINNCQSAVNSHDDRAKMNYKFLGEVTTKSVKNLPHARLGTSSATSFGDLDIYFVLLDSDLSCTQLKSIVFNEIKLEIQRLGVDASSILFSKLSEKREAGSESMGNREIEWKVSCKEFIDVIKPLFSSRFADAHPVIYFETFGNKRSTITNHLNINDLKEKIFSAFKRKYKRYINVDVCLSASYGEGTVTLAKPKFFDEVNVKPNYYPLFSDTVINCHRTKSSVTKNSIKKGIGIFKNVIKLNFYSTYTYYFDFDKSKSYQFPLSLNSMLTNMYGHKVYVTTKKSEHLEEGYLGVERASKSGLIDATCVYRCEVRCNLKRIEKIVSQLNNLFVPSNFGYYSSNDFFKVLQLNLNNFINLIKTSNEVVVNNNDEGSIFESKVYSIIAEYIMKTLYVSGSKPTTAMPKGINDLIIQNMDRYSNSIGVLTEVKNVIDRAYRALSIEDRFYLLEEQILYAPGLIEMRKELLRNVLMVSFNMIQSDINSCIKWILEIYVAERNKSLTASFNDLLIPVNHQESINVMTALKDICLLSPSAVFSNITKILYTFMKLKFRITSDENAMQLIANFMQENNIVSLYKYKNPSRQGMLAINFNNVVRVNAPVQVQPRSEKKRLVNNFIERGQFRETSRAQVTEDDIIRYLHAMYRYTDSGVRVTSVLYDFAYGLFPLRNDSWVKNRQHTLKRYLLTNRSDFNRLLKATATWSPDQFTLSQRLMQLSDNGIVLSDELKAMFIELTNADTEAWWNSSVREDIIKETTAGIFNKVVKQSSAYVTFISTVNEWSEDLIGQTAPVRIAADNIEPLQEVFQTTDNSNHPADDFDYNINIELPVIIGPHISSPKTIDDSKRFKLASDNNSQNDFQLISDINVVSRDPISPFDQLDNSFSKTSEISRIQELARYFINKDQENHFENMNLFDQDDDMYVTDNVSVGIPDEIASIDQNINLNIEAVHYPISEYDSLTQSIKEKLFNKYRFKTFVSWMSKNDTYNNNNRPSSDQWNKAMGMLVKTNILSNVSTDNLLKYKFNLKVQDNSKFLTFAYVKKSIDRSLGKVFDKKLTAGKLRHQIAKNLRPSISDWDEYLTELVRECHYSAVDESSLIYYTYMNN